MTPLHLASFEGFDEIVEILLEHRSNIALQTKVLIFFFFFDFYFQYFFFVFFFEFCLFDFFFEFFFKNSFFLFYFLFLKFFLFLLKDGETALHFAALKGFEQTVKILLEHGSNILLQDKVL